MKFVGVDTIIAAVIWGLIFMVLIRVPSAQSNIGHSKEEVAVTTIVCGLIGLGGPLIYFIPIWIAGLRDSRYRIAILVITLISLPLDLAVGFGLLLWLGALIWAIASPSGPPQASSVQVVVHSSPPISRQLPPLPNRAGVADELQKLVALRDAGHISETEFIVQKGKLLS